jgi:hypothetical protein
LALAIHGEAWEAFDGRLTNFGLTSHWSQQPRLRRVCGSLPAFGKLRNHEPKDRNNLAREVSRGIPVDWSHSPSLLRSGSGWSDLHYDCGAGIDTEGKVRRAVRRAKVFLS